MESRRVTRVSLGVQRDSVGRKKGSHPGTEGKRCKCDVRPISLIFRSPNCATLRFNKLCASAARCLLRASGNSCGGEKETHRHQTLQLVWYAGSVVARVQTLRTQPYQFGTATSGRDRRTRLRCRES